MPIPSHYWRLWVVLSLKASRTWWPLAACSAVILGVSCWRGLSSADTPLKLTAALLLCVTCSSTEVRGTNLLFRLFLHFSALSGLNFNLPPCMLDDIMWFKPIELRTKWGRRGHIKEALGESMNKNNQKTFSCFCYLPWWFVMVSFHLSRNTRSHEMCIW